MDWGIALQGIGAGLSGAMEGYSYNQDRAFKDKQLKQQAEQKEADRLLKEELARQTAEIRMLIAQMNEGGRTTRHETPSGNTLATVAGANERAADAEVGRMNRWNTPSANALVSADTAADAEAGRADRHVTPSGSVLANINAAFKRHTTPSGNALTAAGTATRGQDVSAETARRGQDMSAGTARHVANEATKRANIRRDPYAGLTSPPTPAFDQAVTPPAADAIAFRPRGSSVDFYRWPDGTERAYPPPGGATAPGGAPATPAGRTPVTPVTPPASTPPAMPKSPEAVADKDAQRRKTFESLKLQIEDRKKKGMAFDDLIKAMQKLKTGGAQ